MRFIDVLPRIVRLLYQFRRETRRPRTVFPIQSEFDSSRIIILRNDSVTIKVNVKSPTIPASKTCPAVITTG